MTSKAHDELLELSSEESQSEDDEDAWMLTEDVEKDFYKTLTQIKTRDPKIYQKNVEFFTNIPKNNAKVKTKSNPFTLRDYERKIIVEKGGELSDDEQISHIQTKKVTPTYVEEQESLKSSLKAILHSDSEDETEDSWGGLLRKKEKTKKEKDQEEENYKEWLQGEKNSEGNENVEKDVKPLSGCTDPNLNEDDLFLQDYVLNKKFLEKDGDCSGEDEEKLMVELEENKDHGDICVKYDHRFEEPDQEYIKRYPRVMENSVRRKNDHRKQKRIEAKERKMKEKEKKRAEIKHKQRLKKKEIEDKIEELKRLTGNSQLAFENVLNKDFDFEEHDKAMESLFNEEFYSQDDPNFKPSDSTYCEGSLEDEAYAENGQIIEEYEPHCEDPDFNMDCDYEPTKEKPTEKTSRSRRRKDKHRRTTLNEAVNQEKPTFDPETHKSFQEYVDQYYAIDCEDFIGDLPCKFKYRRTVPNSYGLTVEEILAADSKELDRWCSIKRIQQLRPEHKEKGDVKVFRRKAADEELKRKVLPSLFKPNEEPQTVKNELERKQQQKIVSETKSNEEEHVHKTQHSNEGYLNTEEVKNTCISQNKKSKKQKLKGETGRKEKKATSQKRKHEDTDFSMSKKKKKNPNNNEHRKMLHKTSKQKKTNNFIYKNKTPEESRLMELSDARLLAYGIKPKKFRNKLKYGQGKS